MSTETSKEKLVLMIEDDQITALVNQLAFEELGYTVHLAENGKIALEKIASEKYTLIVTDIGLPDTTGDCLAKQISQTNNPNQKTPIIGLTAHLDKEKQAKCLESGMMQIFEKPIINNIAQTILVAANIDC